MKAAIVLALTLFTTVLQAQDVAGDLRLLNQQTIKTKSFGVQTKKKSFRPLSILYGSTLGLYQKHISPQWGANCAFELTCSRFSGAMVKEYGLTKGYFLTFDRLARCNKISFYETLPIRINANSKIIDKVEFYRLHP